MSSTPGVPSTSPDLSDRLGFVQIAVSPFAPNAFVASANSNGEEPLQPVVDLVRPPEIASENLGLEPKRLRRTQGEDIIRH